MFYLHLGSRFCQLHPYFLQKGPLCHLNCRETVSEVNSFQTLAGSQLLSSADYALAYYIAWGLSGSCVASHGRACSLFFPHPLGGPLSCALLPYLSFRPSCACAMSFCGLEQIPALSCCWY